MVGITAWTLPRPNSKGPPFFTRSQISGVLHQIGTLLELKGANPFRTRSYFNASRLLSGLTDDLNELVITGAIFDLKGIGKGIGSAITQAIGEGDWPSDWEELYRETPHGLIEMLGIPNLGPKRIKQIHDELGINNIAELQLACENEVISPLKGFGDKSQQRIIDGIELLKRFNSRRRLNIGLMYGEAFESKLASIPDVLKVQLAGSARRRKETIGDLDLVVAVNPESHDKVSESILSLSGIADVKGAGDSKISLILDTSIFDDGIKLGNLDDGVLNAIGGDDYQNLEASGTIDAQVRLVPIDVFPFTLAYFTGSKEHNVRLRQRALDRGMKLNEFGLIPLEKSGELKGMDAAKFSLKCEHEEDIYRHLDMEWVPPELREDFGEIEAAQKQGDGIPDLVRTGELKGSFHNHTTLSDGEATLEQMAQAAQDLGWKYLGISDHSQSLKVAHGLSANALLAQGEVIQKYNKEWDDQGTDFRLYHGTESDILEGGKLDYDDETLTKLDYVVASVHAISKWKNRDEATNTEQLIKAIEHPATTILGHPTGRILQGRDGYQVDMHAVLRAMAELNNDGQIKVAELNASPYRLDLDWKLCKYAKELGVPISINPDAHDINGLRDVIFGVQIARKGWLTRSDVLNTKNANEITQLFECNKP